MKQDITQNKKIKFHNVLNEEFKMQIGTRSSVIKFIIVCLIPFFSGFFTVWAFWNPIENLNKIPMAIVNNDRDVCVVYDYTLANYTFDENASNFYNVTNQIQCDIKAMTMEKAGKKYTGKFVPSLTDKTFKSIANEKNKIRFNLDQFSKNPLDIDYVRGNGTDYTPVKYWSKTIIPSDFSRHLRSLYDLLLLFAISASSEYQTKVLGYAENEINWFINNKVTFWGTFKENFMAGELIYILSQLKVTLLSDITDKVMLTFLKQFLTQNQEAVNVKAIDERISVVITMLDGLKIMSHNPMIKNFASFVLEIFNQKNRVNWVETIFNNNDLYEKVSTKWVLKDSYKSLQLTSAEISNNINTKIQSMFNFLKKVNPFETKIQGAQFRQYGIGLGQFFICISLWIGAIGQTFIFTRKKHNNYGFFKNYFSKMILMLTTCLIQTTILLGSLLIPVMGQGSGFASLGFKIYGLLYLTSLYIGFIFVLTVQSIWFAFRNVDFAKLICFGYLLMNLVAGGGVFVPFMQASFFKWMSYFVPFTYAMHLFGSIIYGIEISQITAFEVNKEIIVNSSVLLIWPLIFISLTFLSNYFYNLKNQFGTYNIKRIFRIINNKENNLNVTKFTFFSLHKVGQQIQSNIKQIIKQENELKQKRVKK